MFRDIRIVSSVNTFKLILNYKILREVSLKSSSIIIFSRKSRIDCGKQRYAPANGDMLTIERP
jgi:hypothetical protein